MCNFSFVQSDMPAPGPRHACPVFPVKVRSDSGVKGYLIQILFNSALET